MSSNIEYLGIDENFPVAGIDNPTQGFRDNFSVIKNALNAAKTEVELLQNNTVKTNTANDLNGNIIENANFIAVTDETVSSSVSSSQNLSFKNGGYQIVTATGNINLMLADWPAAGKCGRMRVEVYGDGIGESRTVQFNATGGGTILRSENWPAAVVVEVTSNSVPTIFEFWSHNGGATVFGRYLGRFGASGV